MGFYPRPLGWLKVTHTKSRGWRVERRGPGADVGQQLELAHSVRLTR